MKLEKYHEIQVKVKGNSLIILLLLGCLALSSNAWSQKIFNVKSFGARGNGKTNDRSAIQRAIDAASQWKGATVFFPKGTYVVSSFQMTDNYLENYALVLHPGIRLAGTGNSSVIQLGSHLFDSKRAQDNAHLFYGAKISGISMENLVIDMNGSRNLVPPNTVKNYAALFLMGGNDVSIKKTIFRNTAGRTMINIMGPGNHLVIDQCIFKNGGTYPGNQVSNPFQDDFSFVYSEWDSTLVQNCVFKQENIQKGLSGYCGGLEIHGSNSTATHNQFSGCWPAIYISSTGGVILENIVVSNNQIEKCVTGISFWLIDTMKNITISQNTIALSAPTNPKFKELHVWGIVMPNGNLQQNSAALANNAPVVNLQIVNNRFTADSMSNISGGISLHSLREAVVDSNYFSGFNYAGINVAGSRWGINGLEIDKNDFAAFKKNTHPDLVGGYFVVTDTYSPGKKNPLGFRNIRITDNNINEEGAAFPGAKGKLPAGFIALPSDQMKNVFYKNNLRNNALTEFTKVITHN